MKKGDLFNAYTVTLPRHLAHGCPCKFVKSIKKGRIIYATCKDLSPNPGPDVKRMFPAEDFDIVPC